MIQKQTYEELEQRIQELKKEALERKRAEGALEESETRCRRLFETAQDGWQKGLFLYCYCHRSQQRDYLKA